MPTFDLGVFRAVALGDALPFIAPGAVTGLKFSAALPPDRAQATLAEHQVPHNFASALVLQAR